jgi:hypothetical protein
MTSRLCMVLVFVLGLPAALCVQKSKARGRTCVA